MRVWIGNCRLQPPSSEVEDMDLLILSGKPYWNVGLGPVEAAGIPEDTDDALICWDERLGL